MQGDTPIIVDLFNRTWNLTYDEQVKILSYLIELLKESVNLPHGLRVRVAPIQYLGGPYPCISLYAEKDVSVNVSEIPDPFSLEAKLNGYIKEIGKEKLLKLSVDIKLTWQEVLSYST